MHSSSGVMLLAAVGGYLVLERSTKQKGLIRRVGQVVGWIVIIASLGGVLCQATMCLWGNGGCPIGKSFGCPFSSGMKNSPAPSSQ